MEHEPELPLIDAGRLEKVRTLLHAVLRLYHRVEATGQENLPDSGALIVGNHSGGIIAMDAPIIALSYWEKFGIERPLRVLAHDVLMVGPIGTLMQSVGFLSASRENALAALQAGGATIVFPGGDYDVYRPTNQRNVIDFNGRTGYVRTAIEAGVPIVPVVSIGGQETQLVLSRGERLAKLMPFTKVFRTKHVPVALGFPWGLSMGIPPNLPLPSKIVTRFLEPIDPAAHGNDVAAIDQLVRDRMQAALDEMAEQRRFPILG
jgi:1-acyl-sn-glycerol-3-phosphate acyltransferase